jgi:sirohydrochlorin ferrochelatase
VNLPTLVAVSHGTSDAEGQATVARLVDAVRDRIPAVDVRQAFVDVESPSLDEVLAGVEGPATVVPLLMGTGFHVHVDIASAIDQHRRSGFAAQAAGTLGPDPLVTAMLVDRVHAAGLRDDDAVVLGVAGSSDIRARLAADRAAALLAARLRRRVRVGHLGGRGRAAADVIADARRELEPGGRVVVASYLLAPGFFTSRLDSCGADIVTAPLAGGVAVDQRLVDVVVRRYDSAALFARAS